MWTLSPCLKEKKFNLSNLKVRPRSVHERNLAEMMCIHSVQKECYDDLYFHILILGGQSCTSVKKELKIVFKPLKNAYFCG